MPILTSTYEMGPTQADGRAYCTETHTDHTGRKHTIEYLADVGFDCETCLALRAERLGAEIDRREAAELEANNFVLPIAKIDFLRRMTPAERVACRTLAKTDPIAEDFMNMLDMADNIVLGNADLMAGLSYMESMGCLETGRAQEIGNG